MYYNKIIIHIIILNNYFCYNIIKINIYIILLLNNYLYYNIIN